MACHNRAGMTVGSITSVINSAITADISLNFVVFDDGSSDSTAEELKQFGDLVFRINGDGDNFWAKSMALAEKYVLSHDTYSSSDILWLNDDVVLSQNALSELERLSVEFPKSIIVGAVADPVSNQVVYAGLKKQGWHPLNFIDVWPSGAPRPIESFHGNVVFIPRDVALNLGSIDGEFTHAFADIDYGWRATKSGIPIVLTPSSIGFCAPNLSPSHGTILRRWKNFIGVKGGGNYKSVKHFVKKFEPKKWPWSIYITYVLWWSRNLKSLVARK